MTRITIPDVLKALEEQTDRRFVVDDFVPVPCCMPTCNFVTYALVDGGTTTPITRILDIDLYLDYLKNRTLPRVSDDLLKILERFWSSSAPVGSDRAAADFMDPWIFNVKNVMKCCVEFLVPDGRMIPFCAYNSVGYREQVAAQLNRVHA